MLTTETNHYDQQNKQLKSRTKHINTQPKRKNNNKKREAKTRQKHKRQLKLKNGGLGCLLISSCLTSRA